MVPGGRDQRRGTLLELLALDRTRIEELGKGPTSIRMTTLDTLSGQSAFERINWRIAMTPGLSVLPWLRA